MIRNKCYKAHMVT